MRMHRPPLALLAGVSRSSAVWIASGRCRHVTAAMRVAREFSDVPFRTHLVRGLTGHDKSAQASPWVSEASHWVPDASPLGVLRVFPAALRGHGFSNPARIVSDFSRTPSADYHRPLSPRSPRPFAPLLHPAANRLVPKSS
jgi:hypothetical protein